MQRDLAARAWIAAGSNLGDRHANLAAARAELAGTQGILLIAATDPENTSPLGGLDQPMYLNQMLMIETAIGPSALLDVCQAIERAAGRDRVSRWCSRTLDLDVVRYDDLLCDLPDLSLPHPGLRDRLFWAREIAHLETHG